MLTFRQCWSAISLFPKPAKIRFAHCWSATQWPPAIGTVHVPPVLVCDLAVFGDIANSLSPWLVSDFRAASAVAAERRRGRQIHGHSWLVYDLCAWFAVAATWRRQGLRRAAVAEAAAAASRGVPERLKVSRRVASRGVAWRRVASHGVAGIAGIAGVAGRTSRDVAWRRMASRSLYRSLRVSLYSFV